MNRAIIAGWFSFEQMGASAGDLLARDLVCQWLEQANCPYDVALAPPFSGGVDWRGVDPTDYSLVVFVCGPFGNGKPITEFLPRFAQHRLIGVNLTMLESLEVWNPFDVLFERDSCQKSRPDIALLSTAPLVPVVGLVLIDDQPEYGARAWHKRAHEVIQRFLKSRDDAVVTIDTRLDENQTGLRSPAEIESLIARMDVIVTTRLHGLVLALKNGVPVVAIDSVEGGAKVRRQANVLQWPIVLNADSVTDEKLRESFEYCLSDEARTKARICADNARPCIEEVRSQFIDIVSDAM